MVTVLPHCSGAHPSEQWVKHDECNFRTVHLGCTRSECKAVLKKEYMYSLKAYLYSRMYFE
ncbi:hypothetical protein FRC0535_01926 [Corynebacterium diphtheriae]|nr:hypothetical protein FRC0535_01926 [Corynebacterium diphtheriae]